MPNTETKAVKAHSTAIISPHARIADDVVIGPYVVVEEGAVIGPGSRIASNAYICANTFIGAQCIIHMGACLGGEPQDLAYKGAPTSLVIGDNNVFREHVTVHRGTEPGTATTIGNGNYFMCLSHIAHNCRIGNKVTVCNNTLLAGYVEVEDMAFISASCLIHQFVRVGTLAMIGGGVRINKDFPPYMLTLTDNIVESYNVIGLKKAGLHESSRSSIRQAFRILYRNNVSMPAALEQLADLAEDNEVQHIVDFIKSSKRGVCTAYSARNKAKA
jgi:UDP-N-acetylglucosamine acyltransferase